MAPEKKKNSAVINYISILFMAAFLLMMMTYLMEQREAAEILQGLRSSVSAMQSVEELYEENTELKEELTNAQRDLLSAQEEVEELSTELQDMEEQMALSLAEWEQESLALDWFWQVKSAYLLQEYDLCAELIEEMGELYKHLPTVSKTANDSYSPAHLFLTIQKELKALEEN